MHKKAYVEYQPLGVLGVIAPWNYPFHNMYNHVISGLFAGNAVVSKVSFVDSHAWGAMTTTPLLYHYPLTHSMYNHVISGCPPATLS